jgi:hypothetical protein
VLPGLTVLALATQDLATAGIVLVTLPLVPVFGALVGLATRPVYRGNHPVGGWRGLCASHDQHLGGVVMLAIGGIVYLGGALVLATRLLRRRAPT